MDRMAAGTQRQTVLDDFNVVCCFCVVLSHSLALGVTQADPRSWQAAVIYFPWLAARFSVPGFLFVGAAKVGLSQSGGIVPPYPTYIKRRARKVLLPYLLWMVVYYACFIPIGYVAGRPSEFLYYLWSGTLSAQFYYVFVVMQLYLLRPLWFRLSERVRAPLALPVSFLLMLIAGKLLDRAASCTPLFAPVLNRSALRYLFYWVTGLYAGKYFRELVDFLRRRQIKPVCLAILAVYYIWSYLEFRAGTAETVLYVLRPISNLAAILLLLCLCLQFSERRPPVLDFLHRSSMTVFFFHCLILTLVTAVFSGFGITHLSLLLPARLLLASTLPVLLYWASQRLRAK